MDKNIDDVDDDDDDITEISVDQVDWFQLIYSLIGKQIVSSYCVAFGNQVIQK